MSALVHLDHADVMLGARVLVACGDFAIDRGERVALMGQSGAGKSLMLGALAGRLRHPLTLRPGSRHALSSMRVGLIPQRGHDALHPLQQIGRQLMAVSQRDRHDVVDVLERTGLEASTLWNRRPAELSGGQAQRVSIAMAVLAAPDLVLADEPTSALDHETRDETLDVLDQLLKGLGAAALVVATHDPDVPARLGARVVLLAEGRVVSAGIT